MSVIFTKRVGSTLKLGLWHITESLPNLLKIRDFTNEELSRLNAFMYEKRKKEWLVSRILAGEMLDDKNVQIIYNANNKPFLKGSSQHISLSHSHELLTVIIDEKETGIDLELVKPTVGRIKDKFMSEKELKEVGNENVLEKLTLYWCVKESLYKYYGKKELVFMDHLRVEPFVYTGTGSIIGKINHTKMKRSFELKYERLSIAGKDFMMAYIVGEVF